MIVAVQFTFGISLGLAKISICLLLMRIFVDRAFRRVGEQTESTNHHVRLDY